MQALVIFAVLLSIEVNRSAAIDASGTAAIARLRKDILRDYDPLARPCASISDNTTIKLGMNPIAITKLDETGGLFHLETFIKMTWDDMSFKWDPEAYDGIKILYLTPEEIWKPDISVYQGQGDSIFLMKKDASALVYNTGKVIWVPPVSIKSMCGDLNYDHYPNDQQTCTITLGSWTHSGLNIDLQPDEGFAEDYMKNINANWQFKGMTKERQVKFYPCCTEPYVSVNFNITMTRLGSESAISTNTIRNTLLVLVLAMFWMSPSGGTKKLMPGLAALLGQIGLLILATLLSPSVKALPHIVFPMKISIIFTTSAILIELLVISVTNWSSNCASLTALGSVLNSKAIKVLVANSCRPNERDSGTRHTATVDEKTGSFKNWPLVATLIDRLSFIIFTAFFVAICAIWR